MVALPTNADHKQQLCLRTDIETTLQTGLALKLHQLLFLFTETAQAKEEEISVIYCMKIADAKESRRYPMI